MRSRTSPTESGPQPPSYGPTLSGLRHRRGWERHPGVRSGGRLGRGERAADVARDVVGSWAFLGAVTALVVVAGVLAIQHDHRVGPVAVLGLILSGLALVEVSLVLMAIRRRDRTASEQALHDLAVARRAEAVAEERGEELERLRAEVARLAARVQTSRRTPEGRGDDDGDEGRAILGWQS